MGNMAMGAMGMQVHGNTVLPLSERRSDFNTKSKVADLVCMYSGFPSWKTSYYD